MNSQIEYTLETLFEQLGLDGSEEGMERFVAEHRPLVADVDLADAPFWSPAQAGFLSEAIAQDGAWALPVGELDALLR